MYNHLARKPYPSDLSDAQWDILVPFIPEPSPDATRKTIARREILNGIMYLLRTGCSWRQMPHDLPEREKRSPIVFASGNVTAPGKKCEELTRTSWACIDALASFQHYVHEFDPQHGFAPQ